MLRKKMSHSDQKILVISTTALGDTLWATPSLESLRKTFPKSYLAVLTSAIGEEVLRYNPWTDDLFVLKGFQTWKQLPHFSDIILLHASQRYVLPMAALLGSQRIVGTIGINKGLDSLLTDPIDNRKEHEIERRLQLIERIGAKRESETLSFFLQPQEIISSQPKTIALHPGSKDPYKRWPKEHFIEVGKHFKKMGYEIMITGTKEELSLRKEIADGTQGTLLKDLNLREFAAWLNTVDLLISNDTGPVHLACALKRPVIAIYSATDPKLCGPHKASSAITFSRPATCQPCLKRACQRPFCFMQIGAEEVIHAAKTVFNGKYESFNPS